MPCCSAAVSIVGYRRANRVILVACDCRAPQLDLVAIAAICAVAAGRTIRNFVALAVSRVWTIRCYGRIRAVCGVRACRTMRGFIADVVVGILT